MTYQSTHISGDQNTLPKLPRWVASGRSDTLEAVAFGSGAALTVLDQLVCNSSYGVPVKLLANRLAIRVATVTSKLEGRLAREADIRDAYYLTPPGDARGPDGDLLAFWRDAVRVRLTGKGWDANFVNVVGARFEDDIMGLIDLGVRRAQTEGPLAGGVRVMRAVLEIDDRAERVACLLCDIVLARALGWATVLPVSALRLSKPVLRDLCADRQGGALVVQQRLLEALQDAIHLARDLSSKAAALRAVAQKLRAKGSDAALELFLTEDAVAPSMMMSPVIKGTAIPMTDRAARRFCHRLVELGRARELTGRPTFRLYGL